MINTIPLLTVMLKYLCLIYEEAFDYSSSVPLTELPQTLIVLCVLVGVSVQSHSVFCIAPSHSRNCMNFSLGFKEKDSAFLGQSVKICIQGQFFVPNKTRRGTCLIF